MPSSTLKRSVAIVAVVAGLLAAAGPPSGLVMPQGFIMKDGNICDPMRHMGC
jgi:hypothetical protein